MTNAALQRLNPLYAIFVEFREINLWIRNRPDLEIWPSIEDVFMSIPGVKSATPVLSRTGLDFIRILCDSAIKVLPELNKVVDFAYVNSAQCNVTSYTDRLGRPVGMQAYFRLGQSQFLGPMPNVNGFTDHPNVVSVVVEPPTFQSEKSDVVESLGQIVVALNYLQCPESKAMVRAFIELFAEDVRLFLRTAVNDLEIIPAKPLPIIAAYGHTPA